MSASYIAQSSAGAIMLSDKYAHNVVCGEKDLNFFVPKLFRVYPNVYAGAVGSVPIYKKALDDLAIYLYANYPIDPSGQKNSRLPSSDEVLRVLSSQLADIAYDYRKNRTRSSDLNYSEDARVFLVMAGSYVASEDIAEGRCTSCYSVESSNNFQPKRLPGCMVHSFSELSNTIWNYPSVLKIRQQGVLQQLHVLVGIHNLCSTLGTYISADYNAVIVGSERYTLMNGTIVDLPCEHLVY